jgi:hypothetical protein
MIQNSDANWTYHAPLPSPCSSPPRPASKERRSRVETTQSRGDREIGHLRYRPPRLAHRWQKAWSSNLQYRSSPPATGVTESIPISSPWRAWGGNSGSRADDQDSSRKSGLLEALWLDPALPAVLHRRQRGDRPRRRPAPPADAGPKHHGRAPWLDCTWMRRRKI